MGARDHVIFLKMVKVIVKKSLRQAVVAVKGAVIWSFEKVGIKITYIKPLKWLTDMNIKTVLDVGANTGISAKKFHKLMPEAYIYSFEPLGDCFAELSKSLPGVERFKPFNIALGDTEGKTAMNRSAASASSSLLEMADLHKECYPHTAEHTSETIEVRTLDGMVSRGEVVLEQPAMMKIDVQGFEGAVLRAPRRAWKRST